MADMLATPEDLASLLQKDLDAATATLLVQIATAVVQAEVRQRLVQVIDDTATLLGSAESWLDLPQRPVSAVASVELDGQPVTDWRLFGSRLWRWAGWAASAYEPSTVEVVYTHGYAPDAQELQLARGAVLSIIRDWYDNPSGVVTVRIDDYSETYSAMASRLEASPHLRAALRRQYGRAGGLVRI